MVETVLMIISVAAVAGMLGEQFDFYMAFTQSDCEEPDQYIELPDIPAPLLAEYPDLGPGRGGAFVGRLPPQGALWTALRIARVLALHVGAARGNGKNRRSAYHHLHLRPLCVLNAV